MNPTEVRRVFDELLADPAPDNTDVNTAIRRGGWLRRRRHALMIGTLSAVIVVASLATYGIVRGPATDTGLDPSKSGPDSAHQLSVKCTPEGIVVSGNTFAASPEGAVLDVSSTMPDGTYLNFETTHGGSGDALPKQPTRWTLSIPPGDVTLSCTLNGDPKESAIAHVTLTDPGRYWHETTLEGLGCTGNVTPEWPVVPGTGDSAKQAVDALLADMSTPRRNLTGQPTDMGYVSSPTQIWLAYAGGAPYMSINVTQTLSTFTALPEVRC